MARTPPSLERVTPQSGLTLVEACIAVSITAVLASLAAPSFNDVLANQRTRTVSHLLTAQLASARSTAVTRRIPVTVCPTIDGLACSGSANWSHGWMMYLDSKSQPQPAHPGDVLRYDQQAGKNVSVSTSTGRTLIRFQPNGKSSGSNATFKICHQARHHASIIINNVGRVRTERQSSADC